MFCKCDINSFSKTFNFENPWLLIIQINLSTMKLVYSKGFLTQQLDAVHKLSCKFNSSRFANNCYLDFTWVFEF